MAILTSVSDDFFLLIPRIPAPELIFSLHWTLNEKSPLPITGCVGGGFCVVVELALGLVFKLFQSSIVSNAFPNSLVAT